MLCLLWNIQGGSQTCFNTTILPSSSTSHLGDTSLPLLRSSLPPLLPQSPQSWDWATSRSETDLLSLLISHFAAHRLPSLEQGQLR